MGSFVKIVGYALGKDGVTVTDTETIEVRHPGEYSLSFEKSYYILAREGLFMDIKKRQDKCPNPHSTIAKLNEDDMSRLYCTLYTIERVLIRELPNCNVEEDVFEPGQQYLVKLSWRAIEDKSLPEAKAHRLPAVHHARVITQTTKTICHFEAGDFTVVDPKKSHSLRPVIEGQDLLISRTSWHCELID